MINWFHLFDMGISHGLRNKLSVALAQNDILKAKKLISTSYFIISAISLILILLSSFIPPLVDWNYLLNSYSIASDTLVQIIQIVALCFCCNLTFKIITSVFLAKQMPLFIGLTEVLSKLIIFIILVFVVKYTNENLVYYTTVLSVIPVLVLLIFNVVFFQKKYKAIKPSIYAIDLSKLNDIMGLGLKFFIVQLGVVMLFMTDNLIISHLFSPGDVTPYEISKKYFTAVLIVFSIIIKPYWSAITEAYEKEDFEWIKNAIGKLTKIWCFMSFLTLLMLFCFPKVLEIWVGNKIDVSISLAIQWTLFVILQTKNNIYTFFLNGTGKISLQLITGILTFFINIPLSILFAKYYDLGVSGVLLATNCSVLLYVITRKIQYKKIINKRAYGLWNS